MNETSDLVSIIIPAYNASAYIARSISSALSQTHANVQVVVIDDGSTDDTAALVQAICARDKRVTLVRHEQNRGRLEARRTGIGAATGAFTLFLDADDELASNAAERLLAEQAGRFDIVQCDFDIRYLNYVSPDERRFNRDFNRPPAATAEGDDITHLVFRERRTTWSLCGKLMRTDLLKRAIGYIQPGSLTQAEDACLFFIVSCLANTYKGVPSLVGYVYHIDAGGSDARWKTMNLEQFGYSCGYVDAMERIRAFLDETGRADDLRADYETVRYEHVRAVADKLAHTVERPARPQAFAELVSRWKPAEAIAALSEVCWEEAADAVESVAASPALSCSPHRIRTVAAYHYRMHIGGAERVAATLANVWADQGLRVVFFADEPRENCAYDLPENVIWVELPATEGVERGAYAERAQVIERAVRDYHIDAFVSHQWWNRLIAWDMLLLKTLDVPFCVLCHSIFEILFFEANPAEFDCTRLFRHVDGLVVLSSADMAFWRRFNPRVWQTCNPATVQPDPARMSSLAGKDVVWVGRLSAFDKQPAEALEIMARAMAHDPELTLTLVGTSDNPRDERDLRALARRLGIEERVEFVGATGDTAPYYERASMLLLTSRLDGWCLVLAEAKALGLPCVMYEMPYLTLTQGSRGIVAVPQGDREAAARAVVELAADSARRAQLGADAFAHMCEIASFDLGALWEEVFAELARGSVRREGFDEQDAQWDLLLDGLKESVRKASDPGIRTYAKRKAYAAARSLYHRLKNV